MELKNHNPVPEVSVAFDDHRDTKWPTGWMTQFVQLTLRTFRQSRTRIMSRLKIMESVLLCLLVSLVWWRLDRSEETLRDRMGAVSHFCLALFFVFFFAI
jgi:hypothetical protein